MITHVHIDHLVVDAAPGVDARALEADLAATLSQALTRSGLAPWLMHGGAVAALALPWPAAAADVRLGQRIGTWLAQGLAPADGQQP